MKEDGGPAFPQIIPYGDPSAMRIDGLQGMSLRDYFAIKGAPVFIKNSTSADYLSPLSLQQVAKSSYEFADAMLTERAK